MIQINNLGLITDFSFTLSSYGIDYAIESSSPTI